MISVVPRLVWLVAVLTAMHVSIPFAAASEFEAQVTIACTENDPTSCLNRHGDEVSVALSKAYADFSNKLDTACFNVIGPGINDCLERSQKKADKELAVAYAHAMSATESGKEGNLWRTQLKQSQRAWILYRDADCGDLISSEYYNGTGQSNAAQICKLGHTKIRATELNRRYTR